MDIQVINPSDLDKMFGAETPNPADLNTSKIETPPGSEVTINTEEKSTPVIGAQEGIDGIDNLEDILNDSSDDNDDSKDDDNTDDANTDDTNDDDSSDDANTDDSSNDDNTDDNTDNDNVVETPQEIAEALKSTADYLIENGIWQDFEGREDLEWTNENYAKLAAQQEQHKIQKQFEELVDQTGEYGKAIIEHIKNGGDPNEVIDIFKEEKEIKAIDTETNRGKLELLNNYYTDVLKWKPERVHKHLTRIIQNEEVEEEVADIKERYEEFHAEKLKKVNEARIEKIRKQEEQHNRFAKAIKRELEQGGYGKAERDFLEKSILDLSNTIEGGAKVNDFYVKFAEMQKDPAQYLDLVHFVMDPEGYKTKLKQNISSKSAKKAFEFIKGNAAAKKNATSTRPKTKRNNNKDLDWSPLF